MASEYWSSDTHFHHTNVIEYCQRPFLNKDGSPATWLMNSTMINRWNERVQPEDTVYHLGDFSMGPKSLIGPTRAKLNGKIVLVKGNHDRSVSAMLTAGFDEVVTELWKEIDGKQVWMRHIPPHGSELAKLHRPLDIVLHGHVHELWLTKNVNGIPYINVGVDRWDFRPHTFQELLKCLESENVPSAAG